MKLFLAILFCSLLIVTAQAQNNYQLAISSYIGGGGTALDDYARDITVDPQGNIYVVGATQSSNFPTLNAHDSTYGGQVSTDPHADVIVRKYSPTGTLLWSTFLGGNRYERAYACEFGAGFLYVAGRAGDNFPTTSGVVQETFAGDNTVNGLYGPQDGFIAKFTTDGQLVAATYFGGAEEEFIRDIDVDDEGNCYVGLATVASGFQHITNAFDSTHNGGRDAAVAKISADLTTVLYCSYLGGPNNDGEAPSVRVDSSGNLYVLTNGTYANDNPATSGAYDTTVNGATDFLLAKVNAYTSGTATLAWATFYGGSSSEITETHGLALDSQERPVVMGTTKSTNLPMEGSGFDQTHNGNAGSPSNYDGDVAVGIFSTDGTDLIVSTFYGGSDGEGGEGCWADSTGIYFTGGTQSTDLPMAGGSFQSTHGGGSLDGFFVKLSADLSSLIYSSYIGGSGGDVIRASAVWNQRFYGCGEVDSTNYDVRNADQSAFGGGTADGMMSVFFNTWPSTLTALDINTGQSGATDIQLGTLTASGRDLSGRRSGLRFLYDKAEYTSGDQEVVAQVMSLGSGHAYRKAGVMASQTLRDDSKFAAMVLTDAGAQFLYRQTFGDEGIIGGSVVLGGESLNIRPPYYVKIRRNNQDFSGWVSPDGSNWTQVGSTVRINMIYDTVDDKGPCYIGLAASAHDDSTTTTAAFGNYSETFGSAGDWFYVSATASRTGTGTYADPFHIKQVFKGSDFTTITDSATVWLLGEEGEFQGRWRSTLAGSSGSPITVRGYPGAGPFGYERVAFNGLMRTTLTSDITTTSNTSFTVANGDFLFGGGSKVIRVGSESLNATSSGISTHTVTTNFRGINSTTAQTCSGSPTTHCSGATVLFDGQVLLIDGSWVNYRDFEVTVRNSESRYFDVDTYTPFYRPVPFDHLGNQNKFINLILHDGGNNLTDQTGGDNSEHYGHIVYNMGMNQISGPAGHNLYIQADTPKTLKEIITFNAFANQWNISSTSAAVTVEGSIWFADTGSSMRVNDSLTITSCFWHQDSTQFGPDAGGSSSGSITITNSYTTQSVVIGTFLGGGTITGNVFAGGGTTTGNNITIRQTGGNPVSTLFTINSNKHYRKRSGFRPTLSFGGVDHCYNSSMTGSGCTGTRWQELDGASSSKFDGDGVYSTTSNDLTNQSAFFHENPNGNPVQPVADAVFLRVNQRDTNRANVVAWDWDGNGSIDINPSGFLSSGDIYEVRFAGDPLGDPVITATAYSSGNITVSMALRPMAAPFGHWTRPSDVVDFKVFIIVKK